MRRAVITQSNYIPWKGYFSGLKQCDVFVVFDEMQYTKRDWRNRNMIKTPRGIQWLSIPVDVSGKYFQKIKDTRIADKSWTSTHWNILKENYKTAACFNEVKDWLEPLYLECPYEYLTDINLRFIESINFFLKIEIDILSSSDFTLNEDKTLRLVNICKDVKATDYYSGPAARAYMNEDKFKENNIDVHYFNYAGFIEYEQLFPPFEHRVSILDMIFNMGSSSHKLLSA